MKKVNIHALGIVTGPNRPDPDRHALDFDPTPDPDPAKWCGSDPGKDPQHCFQINFSPDFEIQKRHIFMKKHLKSSLIFYVISTTVSCTFWKLVLVFFLWEKRQKTWEKKTCWETLKMKAQSSHLDSATKIYSINPYGSCHKFLLKNTSTW